MALPAKLGCDFGVALQRHTDGVHGGVDARALQQSHDLPEAHATAVFEQRFDVQVAHARQGVDGPDVSQYRLRMTVAVEHASLATFFVVQHQGYGNAGFTRPVGMRRVGGVADQVAGIRVFRGHLASRCGPASRSATIQSM